MLKVPFTSVCDFQGGTQPPKEEWETSCKPGYIRMLQIRDFTQKKKSDIEFVRISNKIKTCTANDIMIGRYGASIGKILTGLEGAYNVAIIKTIPDDSVLSKHFLYYILKDVSFRNFINNIGGRAAQAGFNKEDLSKFQIPLPPLEDQIRIAAVLARAEKLIAKRKESIKALDEFLKSTFLEMFGLNIPDYKQWKVEPLCTHTEIVSGVTKGKKYKSSNLKEVPYMRVANVQDGHLNLTEIKTIAVPDDEIQQYKLRKGDLLLTEGGDPDKLGRGAVWNGEIDECIHQNHIFRVRVKDKSINPVFLSALMASKYGKSYFLKAAKQTTGIASINSTQLKAFPLIKPPINLQTQFAAIVEKVESMKSRYAQSLTELENLYGSLSQRAFKGELDLSGVPAES